MTLRDLTELRLRAELEQLATTDTLTGINNRHRFLTLAPDKLESAMRLHHPPSLVMLDVDGLKHVNDTYGHAAGDQVLVTFAGACRKLVREIDVFARIGGDEFVLLLPETTCEEACRVMERIKMTLTTLPIDLGGQPYVVNFSAGVAGMADANESLDALLARADLALYRAKEAGRNRVAM